jgi:hypothetical protein
MILGSLITALGAYIEPFRKENFPGSQFIAEEVRQEDVPSSGILCKSTRNTDIQIDQTLSLDLVVSGQGRIGRSTVFGPV